MSFLSKYSWNFLGFCPYLLSLSLLITHRSMIGSNGIAKKKYTKKLGANNTINRTSKRIPNTAYKSR